MNNVYDGKVGNGRKRLEQFVLQIGNGAALAKAFSAEAAKVAFAHAAREAVAQGGFSRTWSVGFHAEMIAHKRNIKGGDVR